MLKKMKTAVILLALILASLPTLKPLLDYGFFPIHDDMQFARVIEMANALRDGQFPVRIVKNLGYGYHYALYNYYAPLPYYVGAFFNILDFDVLASTKLMFILPNVLSIVFMFFLVRRITKSALAAFLAGILYAYFPYRGVDNYVRGTVGELYVMMFLPIFLWGAWEILGYGREDAKTSSSYKINLKFTLSLIGIIVSHNIYALITFFYFLVFLGAWILYLIATKKIKENMKGIVSVGLSLVFAFGITAFFWLPALYEAKFTQLSILNREGYYFGNYFIKLKDLWQSAWGYGGAAGGTTFMIGKYHLLIFLLAAVLYLYEIANRGFKNKFSLVLLFFMFFSVFMTNQISASVWEKVPFLSLAQYPMRYLFFIDFFLIVFAAANLVPSTLKWGRGQLFLIVALFSFIIVIRDQSFFKSKYNYAFSENMVSASHIRWEDSLMSDEYLPVNFKLPIARNEIAREEISTSMKVDTAILKHSSNELVARVNNVKEASQIIFPIAIFPGWKVFANAKAIPIIPASDKDLISVFLDHGDYLVEVKFEDTVTRQIGNLITTIVLALLITHIIVRYKIRVDPDIRS